MSGDISSVLNSPADNQHMALLYEDENQRHTAVAHFINEGLKRDQLCVYGSISYRDKEHIKKISSRIANSEQEQKKGNLVFVDMAPIYISALMGDLEPFKRASEQVVKMVINRADKHIRFVGDCAGFLFKNRHFEECLMLEGWGQQKPFVGSYLCPYQKGLFTSYPYSNHRKSILTIKHDIAIDADKMRIMIEEQGACVNSEVNHIHKESSFNMRGQNWK